MFIARAKHCATMYLCEGFALRFSVAPRRENQKVFSFFCILSRRVFRFWRLGLFFCVRSCIAQIVVCPLCLRSVKNKRGLLYFSRCRCHILWPKKSRVPMRLKPREVYNFSALGLSLSTIRPTRSCPSAKASLQNAAMRA